MRFTHFALGLVLACGSDRALASRAPVECSPTAPLAARLTEPPPDGVASVGYAILPLRNLGADARGPHDIQQLVCAELTARGAHIVSDEALDAVLRPRRVRYTDSISAVDARAVRDATGATYALAGVVFEFVRGGEPRVGLSVRVIDLASGERVQSVFVSLRGVDFRGLLGLGGIDDAGELADRAVAKVLTAFGPHGEPLVRPDVLARARARAEGRIGSDEEPRVADVGSRVERSGRIALLPFVNRSTRAEAGAIFAEILGHAWFQETGVQVIEASELRAALVRARIRSLQEMDSATMSAIGGALDARWFVLGSVERFGEETVVRDQRYPEIEVTVRVVDARTGLVAKSRNLRLRGGDGETILRAGVVRDPLALAARVARVLVIELESGT